MDNFSALLIRCAAGFASDSLSQRLEEEWLADLMARPTRLSRLRFAIGCWWAMGVIAFEHAPGRVGATRLAGVPKLMLSYAQSNASFFSRRTSTLLVIVLLHCVAIYAFATGLEHKLVKIVPDAIVAKFLTPVAQPRVQSTPASQPTLSPRRVLIPDPGLKFDVPTDGGISAAGVEQPGEVPAVPTTVPTTPARVQGGPGKGFPNSDDYYPAASRRLGETGAATVQVCVDTQGRLTAAPVIVQSAGIPRMDEQAMKLAKAGSGHYRPSTEDGRPVSSCYPFRVRFALTN